MSKYASFLLLLILCIVPIVAAQADCPTIVTAALNTATEACEGLGRNQACYGNVTLQATARADTPAFTFEQAGDVVNVADIDSLRLSSMSLTDESWGVALMQLQANLPDTLPGQNVTLLMFGEVVVTNAVTEAIELEASTTSNVNVRLRPTTAESNVITSLGSGQNITANGRLEDSSWIRIVTNAETRELGWVAADFVTSDADLETLTVVEAGAPLFAPMQAFYFNSGIGDRPCAEAPDSGILIQAPEGVGEINLLINEVDIRLGSTIYLQAGNGVMTASVLEGHAVLSSNGVSQTVPAGTYSEVPLDSNGGANGAPTFPQPYNVSDLQALPLSVLLPQSVSVAPALQQWSVQAAIDITNGLLPSGQWRETYTISEVVETNCSSGAINPPLGLTQTNILTITFNEDRSSFVLRQGGSSHTFYQIGELTYHSAEGATFTFTSTTTFTAEGQASGSGSGCNAWWTSEGVYLP